MMLVQRDDTYTLNHQFSSTLFKRRKLAEKPFDLLKVPDISSTRVYREKRDPETTLLQLILISIELVRNLRVFRFF